ncbi:venom serine protease 34-like [Pseudomyrmex gracilis]|uniref:venom serine protease 34-like n=1 Tax=Pseudomyrmex gracilis TaxID=219809 RepID=UPI000995DA39|nr:venom serine protease 34-like [Pseudomyrmex gracilis]
MATGNELRVYTPAINRVPETKNRTVCVPKLITNYHFIVGLFALSLCFIIANGFLQHDCNFFQRLKPGNIYYVYNPDYPDVSKGRQSCKWIVESDYRAKLICNMFDIPRSVNCVFDRLTVYVNNSAALSYCGNEIFAVESTGKIMTVQLSTSFWSSGVKLLCELQAVEEAEKTDDCRCGWKKPTKIVGGTQTGVNEYPMMAGLVDFRRREIYCGATIISQQHLLTAAHCLTNRNASSVGVIVGEHDVTTGAESNATQLYTVFKFVLHPLYNNETLENDIAVIRVNSIISFSEEVGPVCLPFQHQSDSFAGNFVDLLGWGTTEFGGAKSDTLQKVTLSVITYRQCRSQHEDLSYSQLCTYGDRKDACQFDSGGPVLWQNPTTRREVLVGVISFGSGCGTDKPGINTRVGMYIDWILGVTPGEYPKFAMCYKCVKSR